jgi:hypothetical protein
MIKSALELGLEVEKDVEIGMYAREYSGPQLNGDPK